MSDFNVFFTVKVIQGNVLIFQTPQGSAHLKKVPSCLCKRSVAYKIHLTSQQSKVAEAEQDLHGRAFRRQRCESDNIGEEDGHFVEGLRLNRLAVLQLVRDAPFVQNEKQLRCKCSDKFVHTYKSKARVVVRDKRCKRTLGASGRAGYLFSSSPR